ncbi:MAG: hypothetical protein WCG48_03725 [Candidatus Berkelbacteria bacterium]
MTNSKQKTIICSIDGLGISPSFRKNAVKSADMTNFWDLWKNYPHILVENNSGSLNNLDNILFSENSELYRQQILADLSADNFAENAGFVEFVAHTKKNHSSTQLFLFLHQSDYLYQQKLLQKFFDQTKNAKCTNINVNFVYDVGFDKDILNLALSDFERIINTSGAFLSSLVASDKILDETGFSRYLSALTQNKNDGYLSVAQLYSSEKHNTGVAQFVNDYGRSAPISDFDQILVFNFDPTASNFGTKLSALTRTTSFPKYTKLFTIVDIITSVTPAPLSFFQNKGTDLIDTFANNELRIKIYLDNDQSTLHFKHKSLAKLVDGQDSKIFSLISKDIIEDLENNIFVVALSSTRKLVFGAFPEIIDWLRAFDQFLGGITSAMSEDDTLILFSTSGFLENINVDLQNHKIIPSPVQRMPFVIVNKKYPRSGASNLINELISRDKTTSCDNIVPSIIKYLGLPRSASTSGKSILNKMR